jgi:hypothetical protein
MSSLTIQWGNTVFENLAPLTGWAGEGGEGLFAVMVRPKPETAPNDYRILYIGEAEDLSSAEFFRSHPKYRCCVSEAEKVDLLYFAVRPAPNTSPVQRKQMVRELAEAVRPICNW